MTRRAKQLLGLALLLALAGAGALAWFASQAPLDLRPQAERLLRAAEGDVPALLRDTALQNAWSLEELRAEILARRFRLGAFQGWASSEPPEAEPGGGRPRRRLVAAVRFERVPEPVTCTFRFVHRPGGWVLADYDVPFAPPTQGPASGEQGRKAAEELARLVLSRRFQELHARLSRRERRAEPLPALDARLRPVLEGLGRFERVEVLSFEPAGQGHRVVVRGEDEARRAVEVRLEVEFEHTRWVARLVEARRT